MQFPSIQAAFAAQVARSPAAIALSAGGVRLDYATLDACSDHLALRLIGLGAGPGVPVAILMERSTELIIAALAVVKTGAHYVPLHTAYPQARLQRITDQLGEPLLLTDEKSRDRGLPEGCRTVLVSAATALPAAPNALPVAVEAQDPAYVMFTSGSTGEPKGVVVSHAAALSLIGQPLWDTADYDRSLLIAPFAFGMSLFEIWVPLLHGRQIVLYPPGEITVGTLGDVIESERVTVAHLTAGLFRVVAQEAPQVLAPLREVMTGGDVISAAAVARVLETAPHLTVRAMYGATETVLFTTQSPITAPPDPAGTIPVGKPLAGKQVYLLDEQRRPVASGAVGEIHVGGTGLALGYLGHPEGTADRFLDDPFAGAGGRMYRTGDLGRWTPDGDLELLGRADDQIKIRGFRVEPAEVEALLAAHPAVAQAAVIAREVEAGDKRLIAYVVPTAGAGVDGLGDYLAAHLPDYMVPEAFGELTALPLTPNGKIDRSALPELGPAPAMAAEQAMSALEELACAAFAEALNRPRVAVHESFFELSGQSLQAIRIIIRLEQLTGVRLAIEVLYDNPTPAELALRLEEEQASTVART